LLFLRLANLPKLRAQSSQGDMKQLFGQASQILVALDALDRRKPQERRRVSKKSAGHGGLLELAKQLAI
jgi:hypothetical protein